MDSDRIKAWTENGSHCNINPSLIDTPPMDRPWMRAWSFGTMEINAHQKWRDPMDWAGSVGVESIPGPVWVGEARMPAGPWQGVGHDVVPEIPRRHVALGRWWTRDGGYGVAVGSGDLAAFIRTLGP